jgi:hypothetical protein
MISASVPDSEPVLKLLLQKGADVNEKSKCSKTILYKCKLTQHRFKWPSESCEVDSGKLEV